MNENIVKIINGLKKEIQFMNEMKNEINITINNLEVLIKELNVMLDLK